ncbi:hypothetical protein K7432_006508 [Basidiobolus ranarum]|uniref:SH3 domain-containing protein n=1 Tax=Basidiobolus ranarum TaxID=34480 RepID=A0ABR2W1M9_9FUNG
MLWCCCTDDTSDDHPRRGSVTPSVAVPSRGIFVALRSFPTAHENVNNPYSRHPPLHFSKGDKIQLVENHIKHMIGYVDSDPTQALGWLPCDALEFISQNHSSMYSALTSTDTLHDADSTDIKRDGSISVKSLLSR